MQVPGTAPTGPSNIPELRPTQTDFLLAAAISHKRAMNEQISTNLKPQKGGQQGPAESRAMEAK